MDGDPASIRGGIVGCGGFLHIGTEAGIGDFVSNDFAACDCGMRIAEYRGVVSKMETIIQLDAILLSDVCGFVWCEQFGWTGDYDECEFGVWNSSRGSGADFPVSFGCEIDENVRNYFGWNKWLCDGGGESKVGRESSLGGFEARIVEAKAFGDPI